MNTEELIQQCLSGKSVYQKILYDKFSPRIYGICLRYANDKQEADDILQDIFIKIFNKLDIFKGKSEGQLFSWIYRITINTALNNYKKNLKHYYKDSINQSYGYQYIDNNNNNKIISKYNVDHLLAMIQNLPIGYRKVFNLFEIEGYSHKEISKILNISYSTSKTQLFKAKAKLRKQLHG